ncbi:Six-hairpin glycosidase [Favolaschia claudopus]|uniref:Six-hairpin glycosidase n=1 Tax=Favolaschia claudopus TaxID=2862362 RepID=A0AAW0DJW3_9AGAR
MPGAFSLSFLSLALYALESSAVSINMVRPPRPTWRQQMNAPRPPLAATDNNLINSNNLRYSTNISIEGNIVNVLIDTGSTDLWVMPPGGLKTFTDTGLSATLRYGDAYLQGKTQNGEEADFAQGHFGILGLGFDTPGSSRINAAVLQAQGAASTVGNSVLSNIFAENATGSHYIGISLSRTGDEEGTADGSLTIAEYDSDYAAVANAPKLPQTPANSGVWSVVLDGLSVGGKKINWPTRLTTAVPSGKNIVLLDTGTTNILMPGEQVNAIYSAIPGAVFSPNSNIPLAQFSTTRDVWVVPCTATPSVVASFGYDFPVHPLDVTDMQVLTTRDGKHSFTVCVNAFADIGTIVSTEADALFGDSFLRNVYSAYDFGTGGPTKGTPFVQLLSNTDATKSAAGLVSVRRQTMAGMPPELSPLDLVRVFNGTLDAASAVPVTTAALPSSTATSAGAAPTASAGGDAPPPTGGSAGGNTDDNTNAGDKDDKKNGAVASGPRTGVVGLVLALGVVSALL